MGRRDKDFAEELVGGMFSAVGWAAKQGFNAAKQADLNRRENELFRRDGVTAQNWMTFPDRWRF